MAAPSHLQQQLDVANRLIGATNALNELRERLTQAGLDYRYLELLDAYRAEVYEEEQAAAAPLWGYCQRAAATLTDEPVAPYRVAYIAEAPATCAA